MSAELQALVEKHAQIAVLELQDQRWQHPKLSAAKQWTPEQANRLTNMRFILTRFAQEAALLDHPPVVPEVREKEQCLAPHEGGGFMTPLCTEPKGHAGDHRHDFGTRHLTWPPALPGDK